METFLLSFEGFDKVGKTTLINEIDKATNYKHFMLDRGPASYIAYNKLLNKGFNEYEYRILEAQLTNIKHLQICLTCNIETIKKRFKKHNENKLPNNTRIEDHIIEFDFQYMHSSLNKIIINTSIYDVAWCIFLIMNKIKELSNKGEKKC